MRTLDYRTVNPPQPRWRLTVPTTPEELRAAQTRMSINQGKARDNSNKTNTNPNTNTKEQNT